MSLSLAFQDVRWNSWRWRPILERWGALPVFINPAIIDTAAQLVVNGTPDSTIFFVRMPLELDSSAWGYSYYGITTRHSVEGNAVAIRFKLSRHERDEFFQLKPRGTEDKDIDPGDWIIHPDTDLAILPIEFSLDRYVMEFVTQFQIVDSSTYLMADKPRKDTTRFMHRYGVGDEVFSIGLFEGQTTVNNAQSVARFGHIAFQPQQGEKIFARVAPTPSELTPIDAFLVEMATWPGQSGSPVFLCPWPREERSGHSPLSEINFLVGMIQGFYPAEQRVEIDGCPAYLSPVNMGIGVAIPSKDILSFLTSEGFLTKRKQMLHDKQQNPKIKPEMASQATALSEKDGSK